MHIWPAIDLRDGKCVRLVQGDYDRETVFGDDPAAMAVRWVDEGAERLHLVDLDGARDGTPRNLDAIQGVLASVDVPCQLGGGIRDEEAIATLLEAGLAQLVVGTSALRDPAWFRRMCEQFPERLALGLDARDGLVATSGWTETSATPAAQLARQFSGAPLAAVVYTDIARDGMLQGVNLEEVARMQEVVDAPLIASGGVTTIDDVSRLTELGVAGCIVGRALYEESLSLPDLLAAARAAAGS